MTRKYEQRVKIVGSRTQGTCNMISFSVKRLSKKGVNTKSCLKPVIFQFTDVMSKTKFEATLMRQFKELRENEQIKKAFYLSARHKLGPTLSTKDYKRSWKDLDTLGLFSVFFHDPDFFGSSIRVSSRVKNTTVTYIRKHNLYEQLNFLTRGTCTLK